MRSIAGLLVVLLLPGAVIAARPGAVEPSIEQRVTVLERKLQTLSDLVLRLDALQQEVQQLRGEVEMQNHAMDALKQRQRELYLDVDQRLVQMSGPGSAPVVPADPVDGTAAPVSERETGPTAAPRETPAAPIVGPAATDTLPTAPADAQPPGDPALEESTYRAAFEMLMQRRYAEARQALADFLASYPAGAYSDNAQYWLGETNYVTRQFDGALVEFRKVIELYPGSTKVPDAMLKSGYILYEQQQWEAARETLERLVREYPATTASRLGSQRLEKMRSEGR